MQDSNRELTQPKRKHWIDLLRGFCMVAILLDHTEIYYTGD
ncbi:MAG: acyltransferase family protein, partial [Hoylesella marshii]